MSRAAAMDRARLRAELAGQRAYCQERSPLYAAVLGELERDAAKDPPWLARAERAWEGRGFAVGWEAAHLLLACLHCWALRGWAPELARVYPSCGGLGAPAGAAAAFLRRAPGAFWAQLGRSFVQTNEVDRSVGWMLVAAGAFRARGLPFHLVELGASAGLNLVGDHLPHDCRLAWEDGRPEPPPDLLGGPPLGVLARAGLDRRPRRLSDPADRLWLKACVWADDLARMRRLDRAIAAFLGLAEGGSGPRLEACTFLEAPSWLAARRPARPGQGLLVFNSIATIYLDDEEYGELRRRMARALAPWDGRACWVELERARGAREGPLELRVHRVVDGQLRARVLGSAPPRPDTVRLRGGWEFLR